MNEHRHTFRVVLCSVLLAALGASAADWPMYRHNAHRSRVTDDSLSFPLHRAWTIEPAQPPQPAWPPPPRLLHKMDFDYAPHPVVVGDLVCFASSADDTIRAHDLATGDERWQFTMGGPIRFAPQIYSNRVYAAADDGHVVCLDAGSGTPAWTFRAAPEDDMLVGNRRMISRWPCRNGVLVVDNVVYVLAGMWPSEGIYVYALAADTGEVIWRNDSSGISGNPGGGGRWRPHDPHGGEFAVAGVTPQGALLATRDFLVVPLGHNSPATYSRKSGGLANFTGRGSASCELFMDTDNMRYNFTQFRSPIKIFGGMVVDKGMTKQRGRMITEGIPQLSAAAIGLAGAKHDNGKVSAIMHNRRLYARAAYGLALAGNVLVSGHRDYVMATDAQTTNELWRATVDGHVREIAVANGHIVVGTHTGQITAFAPGAATAGVGTRVHRPAARQGGPPPSAAAEEAFAELAAAGIHRGFALVVGDTDGSVATALAARTDLRIVVALRDADAVRRLRTRLLAETPFYGSRIHVVAIGAGDRLPFAQYFANAVIVASDDAEVAPAELARVLRPCGGVLTTPGLTPAAATTLAAEVAGAGEACRLAPMTGRGSDGSDGSDKSDPRRALIVRGALPGARDWNANLESDRRVAWPLRPLWFGGPDAKLVMNIGIGSHPPVPSEGRYFVTGQHALTAVDAYNGEVLWTRPIPSATPNKREVNGLRYAIADGIRSRTVQQWSVIKRWLAADGDHVYLRLGSGHFRDTTEAVIRVDAATGEQRAMYGPFIAGPHVDLGAAQSWPLVYDDGRSGAVTLARDETGLALTLATSHPPPGDRELEGGMFDEVEDEVGVATDRPVVTTDGAEWDLFFDFRPPPDRYGLYERGTFMLTVSPERADGTPAAVAPGTGSAHPRATVSGSRSTTGTLTTVRLGWPTLTEIAGDRPRDFGFAVTLNVPDPITVDNEGRRLSGVVQRHLFGDVFASSLNNGWATIALDASVAGASNGRPAVVVGDFDAMPDDWPLPDINHEVYVGDPGQLDDAVRTATREHPLTGEPGRRIFRSGTAACGNPVYSASSVIGRTTKIALGIYDFADDSGLRFFPGIAANCGARIKAVNLAAALGLLISSESRSHCSCMVPIRTSIVFAPAEKRLNEDWAIFSDRNADAPVRRIMANLGAIGDRRDENGTLWLACPRQAQGKAYPIEPGTRRYVMDAPPISATMAVPIDIQRDAKARGGAYRVNSDRVVVGGTDRPWVYGSGYRGILKAVIDLEPVEPLASTPVTGPIAIDGRLDEAEWTNAPTTTLRFTRAKIFLRHDDDHLYVAVARAPVIDRFSKVQPWTSNAVGADASVWTDDSVELFFSGAQDAPTVHLGISISGARYDALAAAGEVEDAAWDGAWTSAATADDTGLRAEVAIPWATLAAAGLDQESLTINLVVNQVNLAAEAPGYGVPGARQTRDKSGITEPLLSLGPDGRQRCGNFVRLGLGATPVVPPRDFTVRLHFAELDDTAPGTRVFDVKMQGETILEAFDIAAVAGVRQAVVREFKHVAASDKLTLEFVPHGKRLTRANSAIISAIEVLDEAWMAKRPGAVKRIER